MANETRRKLCVKFMTCEKIHAIIEEVPSITWDEFNYLCKKACQECGDYQRGSIKGGIMSNYIKTSDLNLSPKLIKERREDINRWCDDLKTSFNRVLDDMEKGYIVSDSGFGGIDFKERELKWINTEINENYNFAAKGKCSYCNEEFNSLMSKARLNEHKWKAHKKEMDKELIIGSLTLTYILNSIMDGMGSSCAKVLYKETKSEAAKEKVRLMKSGEDIPVEIERQYHKDSSAYYKEKLGKYYEESDDSYLDKMPNGVIPGRKSIQIGMEEAFNKIQNTDIVLPDKIEAKKKKRWGWLFDLGKRKY
jgi:hypothetical protein